MKFKDIKSAEIQKSIKYKFKNPDLLNESLTHRSYINEAKCSVVSNERLEFLGDSILNFLVNDYLFRTYIDYSEGKLTKLKSMIVCDSTLSEIAAKLKLGDFIKLGRGERKSMGQWKESILANSMEAIIAAVYLDSDIKNTRKFILEHFIEKIEYIIKKKIDTDYKSILQEVIQKKLHEKPKYIVILETGPDHNKIFEIYVEINGEKYGTGSGKNKKMAEQFAAKETLNIMKKLGHL